MNQGPFGQNSRPALVGAKYAEEQGCGAAYHDALLKGYWTEARTIEDPTDLASFAHQIGLDGAGLLAALEQAEYIEQVDADVQQAAAYGLSGVPAIVFENRYLISGAQPVATLRQVCDRILAEGTTQA
jgi:predicted DsbA family dithiol-disulfide isomerase